jgi:hypothetical protein
MISKYQHKEVNIGKSGLLLQLEHDWAKPIASSFHLMLAKVSLFLFQTLSVNSFFQWQRVNSRHYGLAYDPIKI